MLLDSDAEEEGFKAGAGMCIQNDDDPKTTAEMDDKDSVVEKVCKMMKEREEVEGDGHCVEEHEGEPVKDEVLNEGPGGDTERAEMDKKEGGPSQSLLLDSGSDMDWYSYPSDTDSDDAEKKKDKPTTAKVALSEEKEPSLPKEPQSKAPQRSSKLIDPTPHQVQPKRKPLASTNRGISMKRKACPPPAINVKQSVPKAAKLMEVDIFKPTKREEGASVKAAKQTLRKNLAARPKRPRPKFSSSSSSPSPPKKSPPKAENAQKATKKLKPSTSASVAETTKDEFGDTRIAKMTFKNVVRNIHTQEVVEAAEAEAAATAAKEEKKKRRKVTWRDQESVRQSKSNGLSILVLFSVSRETSLNFAGDSTGKRRPTTIDRSRGHHRGREGDRARWQGPRRQRSEGL